MEQPMRVLTILFLAPALFAGQRVTVLATTDLHANLYPVDYFTGAPGNRGLAKIATLVRQARAANPASLLVDCGDTIQGTPLAYVYQSQRQDVPEPHPEPMMAAMNALGYDAMAVGNHEFNFGLANFERARRDAKFPWLAANIDGNAFQPYVIKTVAGRRIAIIGAVTPSVPSWEKPENYAGYRFRPIAESISAIMPKVRAEKPDAVIVIAHSGLGAGSADELPGENAMRAVAETVAGIDVIVFGHTHREVAGERINGVLMVQPRNWGQSLAEVSLEFDDAGKLASTASRVIPVTDAVVADAEILRIARPYHEAAERYLTTAVAKAEVALDAGGARRRDSPLVDAIHEVQLDAVKADVSFTSLFNSRLRIEPGPVTVRQMAALYLYENSLYAIEGNGQMVKDALENAARYFNADGTPSGAVFDYNYDMAEGVEYELDLRRPPGGRVVNLRYKGAALAMDRPLRIAVNNYRYGGSGGYTMFRGAKILWRSTDDVRQLLIDYYTQRGKLPVAATGNWRVITASTVTYRGTITVGDSVTEVRMAVEESGGVMSGSIGRASGGAMAAVEGHVRGEQMTFETRSPETGTVMRFGLTRAGERVSGEMRGRVPEAGEIVGRVELRRE